MVKNINIEDNLQIQFFTPNKICESRASSLYTKEPHTINWLNTFKSNEIFLDVGANVGMYSLYSAFKTNVNVFAFEPESQNFAILNKNIFLNKKNNQIISYPIALSNTNEYTHLFLSKFDSGSSHHNIKEKIVNNNVYRKKTTCYKQGSVCATIDTLIELNFIPQPDYIKIDVDGSEPNVINGAANVLKNIKLKSLLVEVEPGREDHMSMVRYISNLGYKFCQKQVLECTRKSGKFKGQTYYIFYKI